MGVRLAARRKTVDLLQERVNALPVWDGAPRLSKWLVTLAGAEDTEVNRLFGRRWLISCIARALVPGCVADGALVLEGPQGIGKNRLITAIFGDAPWVQSIGAYKVGQDIEADRIAGSSWIVHDDEMSVRRSEVDALKAWISRREDTYRPPYGRNLVTRPRRAVLVCSTNRGQYLEDERNRRFWPFRCGVINLTLAVQVGAQLLAEALVAYRAGEGWTISPSDPMWAQVDEIQADRRVRDPIEENIRAALKSLGYPKDVTISKIADTVGIGAERLDRSVEMRYGAILRELGYFRIRVTMDEDRVYLFRKATLGQNPT
jgi:predicted P-loop ATPase